MGRAKAVGVCISAVLLAAAAGLPGSPEALGVAVGAAQSGRFVSTADSDDGLPAGWSVTGSRFQMPG